jgi:4-diphosphocytidyl-2-C-methyl-D-erythritol kinase
MTTRFAAAKINLALHVTGRREDGYHLLDSAVMFAADAGDLVTVAPAGELGCPSQARFQKALKPTATTWFSKRLRH